MYTRAAMDLDGGLVVWEKKEAHIEKTLQRGLVHVLVTELQQMRKSLESR